MESSDISFSILVISLFYIIFLFPACGKHGHNSIAVNEAGQVFSADVVKREESKESILIRLAKESDIPVPVGFVPEVLQKSDNNFFDNGTTDVLCFVGRQPWEGVIDFYRKAMERAGWKIRDLSSAYEGLLFCSKVHKYCVVSVRKEGSPRKLWSNRIYVYLFMQERESRR